MAFELLLHNIRKEVNTRGVKVKGSEFKLCAFADDLLVSLSNPLEDISVLQKELERFGKTSGLKMNKEKTVIVTKNMKEGEEMELEKISGLQINK